MFRMAIIPVFLVVLSIYQTPAWSQASGQASGKMAQRNAAVENLIGSVQGLGASTDVRVNKAPGEYVRFLGAPPASYFPLPMAAGKALPEKAEAFLKEHQRIFMDESPNADFRATRSKTHESRSYIRVQQLYSGLPVFCAEATVQLNEAGEVVCAFSDFKRNTEELDKGGVNLSPTLSAAEAQARAVELAPPPAAPPGRPRPNPGDADIRARGWLSTWNPNLQLEAGPPTLAIFSPDVVGAGGATRLVWRMTVNAVNDPLVSELVLVDAHTGDIAFHYPLAHAALNRQIYDANNTSSDPGTLLRSEGGAPVGLADANNAYDYFGDTYAFYSAEHGRDSINNAGMALSGTVRYCDPGDSCPMPNAFWSDSAQRMYFGQGYASADDVVGHELTHGVTSYESNLIYFNQAGAINESLSDMWGEWVDLTNGAGNDTSGVRWLMGEDLPIGAIRDMSNPPAYGDPDRMGSPLFSANIGDVGGVHYNSGVGNKLCYLLTDGGTFNGHTVTGMGIGATAALLYECAANLLTSASDYLDLYILLLQAADNLGYTQAAKNNLVEACLAVELGVEPDKMAVGPYAGTWVFPMYTLYHDSRTQSIYLASEIGRSGRITGLSLYVTTIPGQTMNNWTIRIKTTALSAFSAPASMDATGWTTCYQANETISTTGQRKFTFSTPFLYDGTSNLMIDFSHNNTSYTTQGICLVFVPGGYRSVIGYSDSTNGDPLNWSGSSSPTKTRSTAVPCIALTFSPASATVTNVTSTHADGTYTAGEVIDVDVTFSTTVNVTGAPRLELETGATNRMASYLSGNGTNTLRFRYTVQSGDTSPDLDYTNGGALQFNGGTIKDTTTLTSATLELPAAGAPGSLGANKAIVIDTTAPTVSSVTSSLADGTYPAGQVVPVQITFSEPVTYTAGTGVAQLQLETGATDRQASYADGSGSTVLTFNYTVQPGDTSADLEYLGTGALTLTGTASIKDAAGNNAGLTLPALGSVNSLGGSKAIVIDGIAPTVSSVTSTLANGFYTTGQLVPITVTFSKSVTYTAGMGVAQLQLETGATDRQAPYADGSGTTVLTFNYTVQAGDASSDLEYLSTDALTLTGTASIKDAAGNNAGLTLPALGSVNSLGGSKAIGIDTTPPTGTVVIDGGAAYTVNQDVTLTLTPDDGSGSGVAQMQFSNDGSSWSGWENVASSKAWTLSAGFGAKTVYVQYRDQAGNVSVDVIADTISYDDVVVAVTVSPDTWAIGAHALAYVGESGPYVVSNTGNVPEDVTIKAGNGSGGWQLQAAPGSNAFSVDVDKGDDGSYEIGLTTLEQLLAEAVPVSGNNTFGLRYRSPSGDTFGGGVAQDFTITLKVSRHVP